MTDSLVKKLAEFVLESRKIVVLTGAGISTESGISDYRSKGGLWDRFQPVTIQEFIASEERRKEYWQQKMELYESLKSAKPNLGHRAIAEMETIGKLRGLITQNIDGLHQMAGTNPEKIAELHGTNRETICLSCGVLESWEEVYERLKAADVSPLCESCGGLLKPNTISFGQALNPDLLQRAVEWSRDCDFFLAVGSTLIVEPAASLPRLAKRGGAKLAIVTLSETPLDDAADIKINSSIGSTLHAAMELVKRRLQNNDDEKTSYKS